MFYFLLVFHLSLSNCDLCLEREWSVSKSHIWLQPERVKGEIKFLSHGTIGIIVCFFPVSILRYFVPEIFLLTSCHQYGFRYSSEAQTSLFSQSEDRSQPMRGQRVILTEFSAGDMSHIVTMIFWILGWEICSFKTTRLLSN